MPIADHSKTHKDCHYPEHNYRTYEKHVESADSVHQRLNVIHISGESYSSNDRAGYAEGETYGGVPISDLNQPCDRVHESLPCSIHHSRGLELQLCSR